MNFSKYVIEFKNRLIVLTITALFSFASGYSYKETLLFLLIQPQNLFQNPNNIESICYFIFTDITEVFSSYLKLLVFLSIQILIPNLFYQTFLFFSPALYQKEYYRLKFGLIVFFIIFIISLILFLQILLPLTWNFFLSFQFLNSFNLHFEAKLSKYLDFYIFLYYLSFFYCQIFYIFLIVLSYLNLNIISIRKTRKLLFFFLIFFSTLISPQDVLSQLLVISCLSFTCEILLFVSLFKKMLNNN